MDRDWVWALAGIGATCWAVGGAGPKWVRRFMWPMFVAIAAVEMGLPVWKNLFGQILMIGAHTLGYGDGTTDVERQLVFLGLALCLMPYGINWWGVLVIWLTALSFWSLTRRFNNVPHKVFELSVGATQGGVLAWTWLTR